MRQDVHWYDLVFLGLIVLFVACIGTRRAEAQQACPPTGTIPNYNALVCWTNATQDSLGAPLPATGPGSLTGTRLQRSWVASVTGSCGWDTTLNKVQNFDVLPTVTTMYFENLPIGKYCYRALHNAEAVPDSAWSAVVTKYSPGPTQKSKPPGVAIY
jgi:hypothetical protein